MADEEEGAGSTPSPSDHHMLRDLWHEHHTPIMIAIAAATLLLTAVLVFKRNNAAANTTAAPGTTTLGGSGVPTAMTSSSTQGLASLTSYMQAILQQLQTLKTPGSGVPTSGSGGTPPTSGGGTPTTPPSGTAGSGIPSGNPATGFMATIRSRFQGITQQWDQMHPGGVPLDTTPGVMGSASLPYGSQIQLTGPAITGPNNMGNGPNRSAGSDLWFPVKGGGFVSGYDLTGNLPGSMPGAPVLGNPGFDKPLGATAVNA